MTRRKAFFMAVVLLVGGVFLWRIYDGSAPESEARREKLFKNFSRESVVRLSAFHGGGDYDILRKDSGDKDGEQWMLTALGGLYASPEKVQELLTTVEALEIEHEVRETEVKDSASSFGFDEPELVFSLQTDSENRVLYFGSQHPLSKRRYARLAGEDRIVLVKETHFLTLKKTSMDLWDRRPMAFNVDEVSVFNVTRRDQDPIGFVRWEKDQGWMFNSEKESFAADRQIVERNLRAMSELEVSRVITNPGPDISPYGLLPAKLIVGLKLGWQSETETASGKEQPESPRGHFVIFFGEGAENGGEKEGEDDALGEAGRKYYFKLRGLPIIYEFERRFFGDLLKTAEFFRTRLPFADLRSKDVKRVDFMAAEGAKAFSLTSEKAEEGVTWKLDGEQIPAKRIAKWFEKLQSVEVVSYFSTAENVTQELNLERPQLKLVVARKGGKRPLELIVSHKVEDLSQAMKDPEAPLYAAVRHDDGKLVPAIVRATLLGELKNARAFLLGLPTGVE